MCEQQNDFLWMLHGVIIFWEGQYMNGFRPYWIYNISVTLYSPQIVHRGSLDYGGSASTFEPIRTLDLSSDRSTATFANVCGSAVAVAVVAVVVEMFFPL